jgi:hypothetical protein
VSEAPQLPAPRSRTGVPELLDPGFDLTERYAARPVHPVAQLVARTALWAAVGIGCVTGVLGLVRSSSGQDPLVAPPSGGADPVPAPVAGVAELAVEAWLTATHDDPGTVDALFVRAPVLGDHIAGMRVRGVTSVSGRRLEDGYWAVDVAAHVIERVGAPDGETTSQTTWYVEVAIVGEVGGRLAALTTPAVLPGPPTLATGWRPDPPTMREPEAGDPVAATVEGFLDALLANGGDPSRYLAPHVTMAAQDPPPFARVDLARMGVVELDDDRLHIWADVRATTPGGADLVVSYELIATPRVDRWEIVALLGSLTAAEVPPEGGDAGTTTQAPTGEPSTTGTTRRPEVSSSSTTTTFSSAPGA